jgi:hypothetical protein
MHWHDQDGQSIAAHRWCRTDDQIPEWLLDYHQLTDFHPNLDNIISESGFYLGAGNDYKIRDGLFCWNWVYSSWDAYAPPGIDDDYECIVNQTILSTQDFQRPDGYLRFIEECVNLFGGNPDHNDLDLVNGLDDAQNHQAHSVNFLVYERRENIDFSRIPFKPLRKSLLVVNGLEGIFLYKLLYNPKRRCKFFLKKRGLGVGFGGQPPGNIFSNHDEMKLMLTQALLMSQPRYFINSTAHTDNEAGHSYVDRHLEEYFFYNYTFRFRSTSFIDLYGVNIVLFLYQLQGDGRANGIRIV